jgi:hypothetical protein
MSVTPSPIGGFAAQFFDNNGVILSGGKIYTYAAGTTTPQTSYTSASGTTPHANPIILDSAGRVPGGEIWLTDGLVYKFVIETAASILIGTYDNITGVNSNFVNYTVQEEVITATAGQTVFNLATINYTPGTNSLTVYIDGVNQYVGDSYIETDSDTVTFTSGVHVGGEVKFTTAVQTTTGAVDASIVSYTVPASGAVAQTVQTKLDQFIAAEDFGVVADGVTDNTAAITNLNAYLAAQTPSILMMPDGVILTNTALTLTKGIHVLSGGHCEIQATGTNRALTIDGTDPVALTATSDMLKGAYSMNITGASNLSVGDILRIYSGTSVNSTLPANRIWLYKQWFKVKAIAGTLVTFQEECQQDFLLSEDILIAKINAVGIVVENVNACVFDGNETSDYQFSVNAAYQLTFKNCRFLNSTGFIVGSDSVSLEQCRFSGYGGITTARGTGRVTFRDCSYYRRSIIDPSSPNSTFIEETPDKVVFENCDFYGAPLRVISSSDASPPKKVVYQNCRIRTPNIGLIIRGNYNAYDTSVDVINCYFDCPGGVSFAGVKTIIDISFCDGVKIVGCSFKNGAVDAYVAAASSIGAFDGVIYDNLNGSTLGLHSSIPYGVRNFGKSSVQLEAGQITFPAMQNPSTDPNTLDDYEEGTFSPTLATDGTDFGTVSYRNERAGSYVKIGRMVYFQIRMETGPVTVGGATGNVVIGGLPFAAQPVNGITGARRGYSAFAIADVAGWTISPLSAGIRDNESIVRLFTRATIGAADTALAIADIGNSTNVNNITIAGCYMTAS